MLKVIAKADIVALALLQLYLDPLTFFIFYIKVRIFIYFFNYSFNYSYLCFIPDMNVVKKLISFVYVIHSWNFLLNFTWSLFWFSANVVQIRSPQIFLNFFFMYIKMISAIFYWTGTLKIISFNNPDKWKSIFFWKCNFSRS